MEKTVREIPEHYQTYREIISAIDQIMAETKKDQLWVAVDGMCGSGKTTMGRALQEIYGCNLFHMDDFFLRPEQRTKERYTQPGGNVDYERFQEEILCHKDDKKDITYQIYDCSKQKLGETVTVPWNRLNIVEGSYSQHPYFGDFYDLNIFCYIGKDEQLRRICQRSGEAKLKRFIEEWIPMENCYFETFGIREKSICFSGEG
jgi:uridine kinase